MAVSPARGAAFDILLRVERDQAFASELLHSHRLDGLSPQDRGLATEIVLGTLRWQSALDASLATHSSQPLRKLDVEVLLALRIAAYQLQFLDRIPANAAVNESVELVKRARKRSAVPFANAVLRKLAKLPRVKPQDLAHPEWMVARWREFYGDEAADAICRYDQQVPQTSLRLPFNDERRAEAERELEAAGVVLEPGKLLRSARRVVKGDVTATAPFARGEVWIQDEASQLVALLAGHGDSILDCCAAPGGKTAVLAERNPQAKVVALEVHEARARLLRERVRAANVEVQTADASRYESETKFDCILADVPCSGTGTLARNPEIKWRLKPEDLADLQRRQVAILRGALRQLAPGGRLVYATCSLEQEEGEAVVEQVVGPEIALRDCGEELVREDLAEAGSLCRGLFLRTIPGMQECDGFFAAVFTRK